MSLLHAPEIDDYYHRSGTLRVKSMACHFLYPSHTQIGGCMVELYSSETLDVEPAAIRRVVDAYSVSQENVSYHCAAGRVPVPPLLRLDDHHLVWSLTGLLSEPFFFLARELKRRYSYLCLNAISPTSLTGQHLTDVRPGEHGPRCYNWYMKLPSVLRKPTLFSRYTPD